MERLKPQETAVFYLCFCLIVAIGNALVLRRFEYFALALPFLLACLTRGRLSTWLELGGLLVASLALYLVDSGSEGLAIALAATCTFLTRIDHHSWATVYIFGYGALTCVLSYVTTEETAHRPIHALFDMLLYIVAAHVFRLIIDYALRSLREKKEETMNKCKDVIIELQNTAHESLCELKRVAKEARNEHGS